MTSTPQPDDKPDETPGGATISDPEVFNDPDADQAEPEADFPPAGS